MKKHMTDVLHWLKGSFTKNLGMKIGSLIFAFLLWAYVATNQNPMRLRTFSNVPITYVGAEDLKDRTLASVQPLSDVLNTVSITVQVESQYLEITTSNLLHANVDLTGITAPGEYTLPVSVTTDADYISINSVMPSNVTVHIEESTVKRVPVEVQITGDELQDYYYGTPRLSQSTIEVQGPRTAIEQVARAVCTVDVTGLEQSITATHTLTLYDSEGNEIPSTSFAGVPAVIVEVPIFPERTVPLDTERIRMQVSGLAAGYEVTEVSVSPEEVLIAGPENIIDSITDLSTEVIELDDAAEDTAVDGVSLQLPDDVYTAMPDEVEVHIQIAPIQASKSYPGVDVGIKNLTDGLTVSVQPEAVDVTIVGAASAVNSITAEEILPFVDLSGYGIGTYDVPLKFENEADLGVRMDSSTRVITAIIRKEVEGEG